MSEVLYFFLGSLRGGGAERVALTLANSFSRRGYTVKLIVLNLYDAVHQDKLDPEVELINLNVKHTRSSFIKIYKTLKQYRIKKILAFTHEIAVALLIVRFFFFNKYIIIARNITLISERKKIERSFWHKYIKDFLLRMLYSKIDHVIAQSIDMKNDLLENYAFSDHKISVIYNPLAYSFEAEIKNKSISQRNNEILFVGRLTSLKGFSYLFQSFSQIRKEHPSMVLRLIGKGEYLSDLYKLARQNNILDSIIFEGYKDDLIPYYKTARLTVLSSIYEGFPNVLVESIACGTPVVAFDCKSGPSEIIIDGVNGFLARYKDSTHLAEMIMKSLDYKWDYSAIKETAKRYRIESIVQKYLQVLTQK